MEKLKIEKNEISNPEEILLLDSLECPIDNMIPLNPNMCSKCHTIFCKDCIEEWKKKSNDCPMRCNNFNVLEIKNSIINQQLNLIKVNCKFIKNGCKANILLKEIKLHEEHCNYRKIKCDKCNENIIFIERVNHLIINCEKNKIECYICKKLFFLKEIEKHIIKCQKDNFIDCDNCLNFHQRNKNCIGEIQKCSNCLIDLINDDFDNHKCIFENDFVGLYSHYNKLISLYEKKLNFPFKDYAHKMKVFIRNLKDNIDEIINLTKDKQSFIESELIIEYKDIEKEKEIRKRKLMNEIIKLDSEVFLIGKKITDLSNNEENINSNILTFKDRFRIELSDKFDCQEKKNEFEKLLINSILLNKKNLNPELDLGNNKIEEKKTKRKERKKNEILSKICSNCHVTFNCTRICNKCKKILCNRCSKICSNDSNHNYENDKNENEQIKQFFYCENCLNNCSICIKLSCDKCLKKCFNKKCNTQICYFCYSQNKGQCIAKNSDDECKIIKCYKCNNFICIMSSCLISRRRYCVGCYRTLEDLFK